MGCHVGYSDESVAIVDITHGEGSHASELETVVEGDGKLLRRLAETWQCNLTHGVETDNLTRKQQEGLARQQTIKLVTIGGDYMRRIGEIHTVPVAVPAVGQLAVGGVEAHSRGGFEILCPRQGSDGRAVNRCDHSRDGGTTVGVGGNKGKGIATSDVVDDSQDRVHGYSGGVHQRAMPTEAQIIGQSVQKLGTEGRCVTRISDPTAG